MKTKLKKRRWKLSESGSTILMILLLGPLVCFGWIYLFQNHSLSVVTLIAVLSTALVTALLWFVSIRPIIRNHSLLSFHGLSEALFVMALLFSIWGTFTLITGYTPTKYNSHPIPRTECIKYYLRAVFAVLSGFLTLKASKYIENKKQKPAK